MARVATLGERVKAITRKYKKVNNRRFFYNNKKELKGRFSAIRCWFLIHDKERGYSIFQFTFKRKELFSVAQWTTLFRKPIGKYNPLFSILTQAVLPAINNKGGNSWTFKALLGWTGQASFEDSKRKADAIPKAKNSSGSRRRNQTTNKRAANGRHRNRR